MDEAFTEPVSLSWLHDLAIVDQVALMGYPRRTISGEVAGHIAESSGGYAAVVHLRVASDRWKLSEQAASQLTAARKTLDKWWNSDLLNDRERNYLIEHRADAEPPPRAVRVELSVTRAYLEMKVRQPPPL